MKEELAESEEILSQKNRMTELRSEMQTIMSAEKQDDVSRPTLLMNTVLGFVLPLYGWLKSADTP